MTALWEWIGGNLSTTVGSSEAVAFVGPGGAFSTPLIVGNTYGQDGTYARHVVLETNGGALPNCKYVSTSQVDLGSGTVNLNTAVTSECTLRIRLTNMGVGVVGTTNSFFDAYGDTEVAYPGSGNVNMFGFEVGDSQWTELDYASLDRLSLAAHGAGLTHTWYVGLSTRATAEGTFSDINFRLVTEYYS